MNKGMLTVGIVILGMIAIALIMLLVNTTTGSELDYYLVKETTSAAMDDAIDIAYYRDNGVIRMDTEKFVENFIVRLSNTVDNTRYYKIGFYGINEVPPKASVKVQSATAASFEGTNVTLTETYTGIIESSNLSDTYVESKIKEKNK